MNDPMQIHNGMRLSSKAFGPIVITDLLYDKDTKELVAHCTNMHGEELVLSRRYIAAWLA